MYVLNRTPSSAVPGITPFEAWFGYKPDVSNLCIFGSLAYVHVQRDKRGSSLGSHMEKCIFLGYPEGVKGWRFYNPVTKRIVISERAIFDERFQPGLKNWNSTLSLHPNPPIPLNAPPSVPLESEAAPEIDIPSLVAQDVPAPRLWGEEDLPQAAQDEHAVPPEMPDPQLPPNAPDVPPELH